MLKFCTINMTNEEKSINKIMIMYISGPEQSQDLATKLDLPK